MDNCVFCKIAAGEMPSTIVYEDDRVVAFRDISPVAPDHILIIPRKHISTVNDLHAADAELVGSLFLVAKQLAAQLDIADEGYRLNMNCNAGAGQTVFHLHLHFMSGRKFNWPPG